MTSLLSILALGFFLGMRHATDPDHVIAVTTIVARQRSPSAAAAIGVAWGIGHTFTMLLVGGGIILFGWVIPPRVGLSTELTVGVMLILLGLVNLAGAVTGVGTAVQREGQGEGHRSDHVHEAAPISWLDKYVGTFGPYRFIRPLLVGVVHGLAGSAAVALLVLATIHDPRVGLLYLVIFGVGTIVGMMLMTAVIALPFAYTSGRLVRLNARLRVATGALSLMFGLFIAYRIGIVDGLFTRYPHWTPE